MRWLMIHTGIILLAVAVYLACYFPHTIGQMLNWQVEVAAYAGVILLAAIGGISFCEGLERGG